MNHPRRPHASRIVASALASLAIGAIAAGCGAASQQQGQAPGEPQMVRGDELAQYEDQIAVALGTPRPQMEADAAYAQPPGQEGSSDSAAQSPSPTATTAVKPSDFEAKRAEAGSAPPPPPTMQQAGPPSDPCQTACRALTSMTSSASHICELAGDQHDRCTSAKSRVQRAEDLVKSRCDCARVSQ